jgi:hypothetical protein
MRPATGDLIARLWPVVRRTLLGLSLAALAAAVALNPALAVQWLSSDGDLASTSVRALYAAEVALVAAAGLMLLLRSRWRVPTPARERVVLGAAMLAGSVVVSALAAETGLRFVDRYVKPLSAERHYFFEYDPVLGWRHRPGSRATFKEALVRIDGDGLRVTGREHGPYRSRVLLLGDSQAFGDGVAAEDTFAARLEADVSGLRVLNASVIGYGTDQQLLYLERQGLRFGPDTIVVAVNAYDLRDNLSSRVRSGYAKPRFVATTSGLELTNVPVPGDGPIDRVSRELQQRSQLYRLLSRLRRNPGRQEDSIPSAGRGLAREIYPDDEHVERGLAVTGAILGRLAETARGAGCRLVVLFLPYLLDFSDPAYAARTERVVASLRARAPLDRFAFIDARSELTGVPPDHLFRDAMHLSAEGHRRVASALERALASESLTSKTYEH